MKLFGGRMNKTLTAIVCGVALAVGSYGIYEGISGMSESEYNPGPVVQSGLNIEWYLHKFKEPHFSTKGLFYYPENIQAAKESLKVLDALKQDSTYIVMREEYDLHPRKEYGPPALIIITGAALNFMTISGMKDYYKRMKEKKGDSNATLRI